MYLFVTYDVKQERCSILMKVLRKYLFHINESFFEGELSEKLFKELKEEIEDIIDKEYDSVIIYTLPSKNAYHEEILGKIRPDKFILM